MLRSRKVASNRLEYVVTWTPAQERQGTALRRDAGSTVQRSRKVATNRHEYVTAWTPAQEWQVTTLRRDAGSILQRSRKLTVMNTSLPGGLRRRGKVPCCAGMLDLLCRDRGRSLLLTLLSTSLPGRLRRRGKVPHCSGKLAVLCRDRGRSLFTLLCTSLPGRLHMQEMHGHNCTAQADDGSMYIYIKRSRKVATNCQEYDAA